MPQHVEVGRRIPGHDRVDPKARVFGIHHTGPQREVGTGRLPPNSKSRHVITVVVRFLLQEANGRFDVIVLRWPNRLLGPGVVDRSDRDTSVIHPLQAVVVFDLRLVAAEPSAAVDVHHHGRVFDAVGKVKVEDVPLALAVGKVLEHVFSRRHGRT